MTLDANDVGALVHIAKRERPSHAPKWDEAQGMSDYVSVRDTLADRSGYRGSAQLGGIDIVISPALPSTPTWMEDLTRYVRHKLVIPLRSAPLTRARCQEIRPTPSGSVTP